MNKYGNAAAGECPNSTDGRFGAETPRFSAVKPSEIWLELTKKPSGFSVVPFRAKFPLKYRLEPLPAGNAQPAEKGFDKLVDGGSKRSRPCQFLLWKMGFPPQQSYLPYTPPGAIGSSKEIRPSRALQGFSTDLSHCPPAMLSQPKKVLTSWWTGGASALVPASFCSGKWVFPPQQSSPPYTPPGTIGSSREIRPSRALQGFSADLSHCPPAMLWITAHCSALAEHRLRRRADRCLFFFKTDIQHTPSPVCIMAHYVFCACRLDGI